MNAPAEPFDERSLEATFYRRIVPDELTGPEPEGGITPELVVRTEQPGAHLVTPQRLALLDDEWAADAGYVIVPSLRTLECYHEDWIELHDAALHGNFSAAATLRSAARWWQDASLEWARSHGCHTYLQHLPPEDPPRLHRLARSFTLAGYNVRLVAAAVPAALSGLAAMEYSAYAAASGLRGTVPTGHAHAHRAIPEMIKTAEACRDIHRITILSRDGVIHDTSRGRDGDWDRPGSHSAAERARQHTFTDVECVALTNRVIRVLDTLDDRHLETGTIRALGEEVIANLIASDGGLADAVGEFRAQRALLAVEHGIGIRDTLDPPQPPPDLGPEP